jgi:AcrR family transcriptional regulator
VGRPREHGEETRKTLLEAAERLLAESGIGAVTLRSVADRAGTSTRAVYALFGSKEGLVQALAARGFDLVSERLDSLPLTDDPVEDLLTAAIGGFRAFAIGHPDLFRLVFVGGLGMPFGAATATAQSTSLGHLVQRVERLRAAGMLGGHRVDDVMLMCDAICTGLANREVCGQADPSQAERIWRDALTALVAGLGRAPRRLGGA